jgi:hypothetical protein
MATSSCLSGGSLPFLHRRRKLAGDETTMNYRGLWIRVLLSTLTMTRQPIEAYAVLDGGAAQMA